MKKLFSMIAIVAMAFAAVSCDKNDEAENSNNGGNNGNGGDSNGVTFSITVSNINSDSARISITPSDNSAGYLSYYIDKETAGNSIETYVSNFVDFINEYYIEEPADWEDFLDYGAESYTVDDLEANTTYIAYAVAIEDGKLASEVFSKEFTTTGGGNSGNNDDDEEDDDDDTLKDGEYSYSTLLGDVTFSNPIEADLVFYGDYYGIGANDWELYIFNDTDDDFVFSEFFTELSNTTGTGTYQIDYESFTPGTALSGILYVEDGETDWDGTWYFEGEDMATGEDGTIKISQNGVTCNIVDYRENTITVNYTGQVYVIDYSQEAASLSKAERHNRQLTRINMRKFSAAPAIVKDAKRVAGKILAK